MKKYIIFILVFFLLTPLYIFAAYRGRRSVIYSSYLKGIEHFYKGEYEGSLRELKKVEHLDQKASYVRIKIAFILIKLNKLKESEKEFKKVQELDPQNLEASLGLIFLYSYTNNNKELEAEYGEFLENSYKKRPEDLRISEYLAQFYFYRHKINAAIKIYKTIVKFHPKYINADYLLGFFYEENGEHKKAIKIWKGVLKNNPAHTETLNALGYSYADQGIHLKEAESMIKKALKSSPNNGAYLDSLGWLYVKKREYKKAEKYLKKAVAIIKDPVIYEHLGDLYIKLRDFKQAIISYNLGLKINPQNKILQKKIAKYGRQNKVTPTKSQSGKKVNY